MPNTLFLLPLFTAIFLTISASSWITAWAGLEINMISFLPLILTANKLSNESSLKYFLTQALASTFILLAALLPPLSHPLTPPSSATSTLIVAAILLKLGAAPFHFWFPPTMEGISWFNCIILSTAQKIAPLCLLLNFLPPLVLEVALASAAIGALGGFNQLSLRKIFAYSAIGHLGWVLSLSALSPPLCLLYFLVYSLTTTCAMVAAHLLSLFHTTQTSLSNPSTQYYLFALSLFSLGGLPPLLGFLPKWLALSTLLQHSLTWQALTLVICSLITLFFYLRLTYASLLLSPPPLITPLKSPNISFLALSSLNLWALPLFLANSS